MWDLSQNDGPTANVMLHIIIYILQYTKRKKETKRICIRIDSVRLYIYFGIRATVKLLEKKGCCILFWYQSTSSIELRY